MDLDGTILGASLELTPALIDAVEAASEAASSRSSPPAGCSARRCRSHCQLGITAPLICYQGALVADAADRRAGCSTTRCRSTLAREVIAACARATSTVNLYVDDELYVDAAEPVGAGTPATPADAAPGGRPRATGSPSRPPRSWWSASPAAGWTTCDRAAASLFGRRVFIAKSLPVLPRGRPAGRLQGQRPALGVRARCGIDAAARCRLWRRRQRHRAAAGGRPGGAAVADADPVLLQHAQASSCPSVEEDGVAHFLARWNAR